MKMDDETKIVTVASILFFFQMAWIFVSVMIISKLLDYPQSFYEYGIAPPMDEYVLPMIRDWLIMFIPSWIYLGWAVKKLIKG